ncbi:MAG: triose-phosphate isomerase family protein [Desulforhopalus sp.]
MKRYVIANWKCHKTSEDGRRWFDNFAAVYQPHQAVQVIVSPSIVNLESIANYLEGLKLDNVSLAAQDVSPFPKGSYTGAVAADMIKSMAGYVIIGHSERRRYFHETSQDVVNKVSEAADSGIVPIVCVDSSNALSQLTALADIECDQLLVAYTPVDALNFNIAESPEKVAEAVADIRHKFPPFQVVYGGALIPGNVKKYLQLSSLSGVFIGASSLEPGPFADICSQAAVDV